MGSIFLVCMHYLVASSSKDRPCYFRDACYLSGSEEKELKIKI